MSAKLAVQVNRRDNSQELIEEVEQTLETTREQLADEKAKNYSLEERVKAFDEEWERLMQLVSSFRTREKGSRPAHVANPEGMRRSSSLQAERPAPRVALAAG